MKTQYAKLDSVKYNDGIFDAGLVKNSKHKENNIYLGIKEDIFELTEDEALAICKVLIGAMWQNKACVPYMKKKDLKWR